MVLNWRSCVLAVLLHTALWSTAAPGQDAQRLTFHGYPDCIELRNATTRVILSPSGGRVLEYSLGDENALYLEEAETGKPYEPGQRASMSAGRFDIGPEKIIPPHPRLWSGTWKGEILGPRHARLTSEPDEAIGTQLVRDFRLAEGGTQLACTQTIRNISSRPTQWCHWSRTFARGNGICLVPLTPPSRFPGGYVMYEDGDRINIRPEDPHIRQRDGMLEIFGVPRHPKLGMDSYAGWFAYLMPGDLLFIKRFPVYPDRVYNEAAALTVSIWYPEDRRVELEPIGPRERLQPGQEASFTEEWFLASMPFPQKGQEVSIAQVRAVVAQLPPAQRTGSGRR
jgi:hypothetical protein